MNGLTLILTGLAQPHLLSSQPDQDPYSEGKRRKQRAEHAAFQFRWLASLPTNNKCIFEKRRIIRHDKLLPGRPVPNQKGLVPNYGCRVNAVGGRGADSVGWFCSLASYSAEATMPQTVAVSPM